MEGLILFLVIAALVIWGYLWLNLASVGGSAPVELDRFNPRDQHEARCIDEQLKYGRERPGYRWRKGGVPD